MTITSSFYKELEDEIFTLIIERMSLLDSLNPRPDVLDITTAITDLITAFSFKPSILYNDGDNKRIDVRINETIESFYQSLNMSSSAYVGSSPAEKMHDELNELVFMLTPRLDKDKLREYFLNLPNDEETRLDFEDLKLHDFTIAKVVILTTIKSASLHIKYLNLFTKPSKVKNATNSG